MPEAGRNALPRLEENCARLVRIEFSIGTLDLFRFSDYRHAFPRHMHESFTVGVFGAGNGRISTRSGSWRAVEGALLTIGAADPHAAEPLTRSGWTYASLYPHPNLVRHVLDRDGTTDVAFAAAVTHDPRLGTRLHTLHHALESHSSRAPSLSIEIELIELLRALVDRHAQHSPTVGIQRGTAAVREARAILEEQYHRQVSLDELSQLCGVSPYHLIRSFRDVHGIPPHAYLMQVRLNHAREQLLRGESLSSIAYDCGFSDQSHLTRTFKRVFGVTPGVYAKARY